LLGDGEQGLGPQADNVVLCVVVGVGKRHFGSAYLRTRPHAVAEEH
jgi:hypothetical protein